MGFDVPASYSTNNLLWWTGIFILNHKEHVYPTGRKKNKGTDLRKIHGLSCTAEHVSRILSQIIGYSPRLVVRVASIGRTLHVFVRGLVQTQKSMQNHGRLAHLLGQLHDAEQQFPCNHEQDEGSSQAAASRAAACSAPSSAPSSAPTPHRHRRRYRAGGSQQHLNRGACCFELRSSGSRCGLQRSKQRSKQRSNSKHRHRRRYRAGGSQQHLNRGACCFELRSSGRGAAACSASK